MNTLDQPTANSQQPSYLSTALNYGLITSLILITISLVGSLTGISDPRNPNQTLNYLISFVSFAIVVTGMVMAIQKHRDEDLGGYINFGRAFSLAFIVGLVVLVVNSIFSYVYLQYIDTTVMDFVAENFERQMEENGISEGDPGYETSKFFVSISGVMIFVVLGLLIQFLIGGLIAAAIGQKKSPQM